MVKESDKLSHKIQVQILKIWAHFYGKNLCNKKQSEDQKFNLAYLTHNIGFSNYTNKSIETSNQLILQKVFFLLQQVTLLQVENQAFSTVLFRNLSFEKFSSHGCIDKNGTIYPQLQIKTVLHNGMHFKYLESNYLSCNKKLMIRKCETGKNS